MMPDQTHMLYNTFNPASTADGSATCIGPPYSALIPLLPFVYQRSIKQTKPTTDSDESSRARVSSRVMSLDTFRGLSITIMIFVNYGGGGYWFFDHSLWDGLTVADLVFPWFIWIMGTSMAFSFKSVRVTRENYKEVLYKIVRRTVILFGLGLFINQPRDIVNIRIPGVLQRFAISYFVVSLVVLFVPKWNSRSHVQASVQDLDATDGKKSEYESFFPGSEANNNKYEWLSDFLPYIYQWLLMLCFLALYLILQYSVPVPGCPTGYIGPGGLGDQGKYINCTGGAHRWIDIKFFGINHIYQTPTSQKLYHTGPHDPEGLVGAFSSIFLCFIGNQAGRTLVLWKSNYRRCVGRWLLWGCFFGLLALVLTFGTQWTGPIPINKNLWSPSFIFATSSMAFFALSFCFMTIDVFQIWTGAPFLFIGMNPILIYCGHEVLNSWPPFSWDLYEDTHGNRLFMNTFGVSMWLIIAYKMWWDNFFVAI
eukprot:TRINITY_DN5957_c0_g1_i5.p1 TRINITY_DN5957_c0_g1~~TRINITY_DN5957_c0_g1_i5.p1  ORF type:complete len:480 (-),score=49.36 TRINITY_DN5957_c0_g1_i5:315-1754(-)